MKKEILFIILIIFIFGEGCDFSSNKKVCIDFQIQNIGKIYFNEQIDSFLADFINENQEDSCIYELYVDKKERDEYQLSMLNRHADNRYFQENHPVNYTIVRGKTIFVYSGIEDFVKENTCGANSEHINQGYSNYLHAWYKIVLPDTSFIVKSDINVINSFSKSTLMGTIEFKPPCK